MLLPSLAEKIVKEVRKLIDEDIIIVDMSGIIIASTDPNRLEKFHEGALLAIKERKNFIITNEMEKALKGVKAGINLPVFFQKKAVGVIGITGEPKKVSPYGELLKKMTELLIQENYYIEQMEWNSRVLEAFVFDWLQNKDWSTEFYDRAALLEIDIQLDRQVVLGSFDSLSPITERTIWDQLQQRNRSEQRNIYIRWGNDRFLILYPRQEKNTILHSLQKTKTQMETDFNVKVSFGVGKCVQARQVKESFLQAERALSVARKTSSILFDDDLKLEMLLQEVKEETRKDFVKRTIGLLLSEDALLETLHMFIAENQSLKSTSDMLHIHVNTLHYRLKKIEELTSLNPRQFQHLVILYLGLLSLDEYTKNED